MKRRNGEGSWDKVEINGAKYFRYRKQYPGMDKKKSFYGKTEAAVREKIEKFENAQPVTDDIVKQETISEYVRGYIRYISPSLTPAGIDGYENILRVRIENFKDYNLGDRLVTNTQPEHAKAYLDALIAHKYAAKTIKKTIGLIKAAMDDAVTKGVIASNPFIGLRLPTPQPKQKNFLSKEQHTEFCEIAMHKETLHERWNRKVPVGELSYGIKGLALIVIAHTGMRVSEALALTWKNVHLDKKVVHVFDNLSVATKRDSDGNAILDENGKRVKAEIVKRPKTKAGIRVVPMTSKAFAVFSLLAEKKHKQNDLVFSQDNGGYLTKDMLRHTCQCIGKRIDIPNLTTHNLRHSFGAILIHQEHVDPQVVSKLIGHNEVATTYDYYSDVIEEVLVQSLRIFE